VPSGRQIVCGRYWSATAVWFGTGDHDFLGLAQRRICGPNSNRWLNRCHDRNGGAAVPRPVRSAVVWFDPDAGSWHSVGYLFVARQEREKSNHCNRAGNFLRAVPFATVLSTIFVPRLHLDSSGVTYAIISGAITSGLGYILWYAALPSLKAASAASVQLIVPVLAATGGIVLLGESLILRYLFASVTILGGIALVVLEKDSGPLRR